MAGADADAEPRDEDETNKRLKESQNTAAMLTTYNEADMSGIMQLRNEYKDAFEKKKAAREQGEAKPAEVERFIARAEQGWERQRSQTRYRTGTEEVTIKTSVTQRSAEAPQKERGPSISR